MAVRMQQRHVAFALAATTVALKAKAGRLQINDQTQFAMRALEMVHDDSAARAAALDFLTHCRSTPEDAGARLQDFILEWSSGAIDPQHPERVLAQMPESTADWR